MRWRITESHSENQNIENLYGDGRMKFQFAILPVFEGTFSINTPINIFDIVGVIRPRLILHLAQGRVKFADSDS